MKKQEVFDLPEVREFINFHAMDWLKCDEESEYYDVMDLPFYKEVIKKMIEVAIYTKESNNIYYTTFEYMSENIQCYIDQNYPALDQYYTDWINNIICELCLDIRKVYLDL